MDVNNGKGKLTAENAERFSVSVQDIWCAYLNTLNALIYTVCHYDTLTIETDFKALGG
jgi:hypothetical protein